MNALRLGRRAATCMIVLAAAGVAASCGAEARGTDVGNAPVVPRQFIVALDLSGSQTDSRRADARRTLDLIIDDLNWGDRLVLLEVHQGAAAEEGTSRWTETAPMPAAGRAANSLDRERLEAVRKAARSVAQTMFARDSAGRLPRTDLIATLHVAAEYVRDGGRRPTTVFLLSDMLQSAHGIEMSRSDGMPPRGWIERQQAAGIVPRLEGACVSVIGADATSAHGVTVREFWKEYLRVAGAELTYRMMAAGAETLGCTAPDLLS